MKPYWEYKTLRQYANAVARENGSAKATGVTPIEDSREPRVIESSSACYRKTTTHEVVPNKYRLNFGWKNTYYDPAVCLVGVPKFIIHYFG
jgi:hypothetical protein